MKPPALFGIVLLLATASGASAQYVGVAGPHAGSVEISGAAAWSPGYDAGTALANETRNPTTGTGPLTLFQADARLRSAPAVEGRVGVFVSRHVAIEGGLQFSRPTLDVHLSGDFELAPDTTASETLTQYLIDGSLVYQFGSGRVTPFVLGGAGHLRQLHDGAAELQTALELHAGGGVKYWFGGAHRAGLRIDARVSSRDKGAGFEQKRRVLPAVGAGFTYLF